MKKFFRQLIDRGTQFHPDNEDKRRCRLLNGLIYIAIAIMMPLALGVNLSEERYAVAAVGFATLLCYIVGIVFNWKGDLEIAAFVYFISSIIAIGMVVLFSNVQTSAVFAAMILSIGSLYLFKRKLVKHLLIIVSLITFFFLNHYQLTHLPFDLPEYLPLIALLILFNFAITFSDSEIERHRRKIEDQNVVLKDQNVTIKKQAEDLKEAEKVKHEQALALKQKDLEMVLTSSSARDQLAHNLRKRLKTVMVSEDMKSELSVLINELNLQKELISKQGLIQENMREVNAEFYDRLNKQFPDLTKLEREFCAYLKLNLSNKEIAAIKNCTVNTVNVGKTRLRKKIGYDTNKELAQFLRDF